MDVARTKFTSDPAGVPERLTLNIPHSDMAPAIFADPASQTVQEMLERLERLWLQRADSVLFHRSKLLMNYSAGPSGWH